MKRLFFWLLLCSACFQSIWSQADFSQIDSLIRKSLPEGSEVGISIYDLTANKSLYTYREHKLSRPASTMKLLTSITALARSEGDLPFRTEVWCNGTIRQDTLYGDLYVVGGFDPEFNDQSMAKLINQITTLPFSVVKGQLYGDVSMKDSLYWGNGWAWDDNPEPYQPYLSPLMYCKGAVEIIATPSANRGMPARLISRPASTYYSIKNETKTRTLSAGNFDVKRNWLKNENHLLVQGNVDRKRVGWINVFSSQDFFMHDFMTGLQKKGVRFLCSTYRFAELHRDTSSRLVAFYETPIEEVLHSIMKESDNLNAEAVLCRLGAQATQKKRIAASDGIKEISSFLGRLGYSSDQYKVADGCGLSNYNYLTPSILVDLLKFAYSNPKIYSKLYEALPIAGVDGTLKNRMKGGKAYKNVRAKTGSFTAINSLAGYLTLKNGHEVAFAIMNQNILSSARARAFQDKVCEIVAEK